MLCSSIKRHRICFAWEIQACISNVASISIEKRFPRQTKTARMTSTIKLGYDTSCPPPFGGSNKIENIAKDETARTPQPTPEAFPMRLLSSVLKTT
jgi:hypothetical protein